MQWQVAWSDLWKNVVVSNTEYIGVTGTMHNSSVHAFTIASYSDVFWRLELNLFKMPFLLKKKRKPISSEKWIDYNENYLCEKKRFRCQTMPKSLTEKDSLTHVWNLNPNLDDDEAFLIIRRINY